MGSYSDRVGESVGGLSMICCVLRERRLASPTTHCMTQAYKLLPLPLQGLYRGLQGHYSALQAFSALAWCILWLFWGVAMAWSVATWHYVGQQLRVIAS